MFTLKIFSMGTPPFLFVGNGFKPFPTWIIRFEHLIKRFWGGLPLPGKQTPFEGFIGLYHPIYEK
jgi:hypothetical protein